MREAEVGYLCNACTHLHTSYFISIACQITKYHLMPIVHKELPLAMLLPENQCYKLLVQVGLSVRAIWNNCGRKVMPGTEGWKIIKSHGRNKPQTREIILRRE